MHLKEKLFDSGRFH